MCESLNSALYLGRVPPHDELGRVALAEREVWLGHMVLKDPEKRDPEKELRVRSPSLTLTLTLVLSSLVAPAWDEPRPR
ncbi:hypothetical protein MHYP_G00299590 [Metynnis hypsauchen]